jgi:hypothetical protein
VFHSPTLPPGRLLLRLAHLTGTSQDCAARLLDLLGISEYAGGTQRCMNICENSALRLIGQGDRLPTGAVIIRCSQSKSFAYSC